jgi:hypothetical protein
MANIEERTAQDGTRTYWVQVIPVGRLYHVSTTSRIVVGRPAASTCVTQQEHAGFSREEDVPLLALSTQPKVEVTTGHMDASGTQRETHCAHWDVACTMRSSDIP